MITLKYDLVTAVQCGYTGKPDQVMREQGYSWFSVIYAKDVNFYEVENIQHSITCLPAGFRYSRWEIRSQDYGKKSISFLH